MCSLPPPVTLIIPPRNWSRYRSSIKTRLEMLENCQPTVLSIELYATHTGYGVLTAKNSENALILQCKTKFGCGESTLEVITFMGQPCGPSGLHPGCIHISPFVHFTLHFNESTQGTPPNSRILCPIDPHKT